MVITYVLAELNTEAEIGEVRNAPERKAAIPLNGLPTASFTIRLDNPLANEITSRNGDVLLKIYLDSTLIFVGDCTSIEESATDQSATLACNFAGPFWRLQKRLIGKTAPGGTYSPFTAASTDPLETTFTTMLAAVNTEKDTGIRPHATFGPLHTASMDYSFTPMAEIITAIQAAKIPFPVDVPPSYVANDTFTTGTHGLAIDGRTDDEGNTWDTNGSGPDWVYHSAQAMCYRTSANDGGPRWAINSAADHGPVLAGLDHNSSERSASGLFLNFHLYARLSGHTAATPESGNWVRVASNYDTTNGSITLQKKIGAATTTIGTYNFAFTWLETSAWYSFRLLVDDAGNYVVWHYLTGSWTSASPVLEGKDTDLSSTGPLATGKLAFGDINISGTNTQRSFDHIFASTYTGPMSFDFETVPVEPVASATYQADGLKIAELKIQQPNIGTDRPDAIFEFGTGGRSVKSYRHITQKEGHLLNEAYSLPETFPPDTGATRVEVRKATDATSITAHGLFQEVVPIDVGKNSLLRQAWVDANVAVRKDAKHTVTFEPSQNAPVFGIDYFVGDTVRARAVVTVNGVQETRFNGTVRVHGVDITIDENGRVEIVPDLVAE